MEQHLRAPAESEVLAGLVAQEPVEDFRSPARPARLTDPRLRKVKPESVVTQATDSWWMKPGAFTPDNFATEAERMRLAQVRVPGQNNILCWPV